MSSILKETLSVVGSVIDSEGGVGLADFSVQLWPLAEDADEPLGEGRSNSEGAFVFDVPAIPDLIVEEGIARVELRLFDDDELLLAQVREFQIDQGPQQVQLVVPGRVPKTPFVGSAPRTLQGNRLEVRGRVWGEDIPSGSKVRAVLHSLDVEGESSEPEIVGETIVDDTGAYRLQLDRLAGEPSLTRLILELQLLSSEDEVLIEAPLQVIDSQSSCVDLRLSEIANGVTEYDLLQDLVSRELAAGPAALDGLSADALLQLADEIDVEPERLGLMQRARALEAETGLQGAIFYGLAGSGMSVKLEDLIDVPESELRSTLRGAVDDRVVSEKVMDDIDAALGKLSERIVERVLEVDQISASAGLGAVLASTDLPHEVVREVLRRYRRRTGGVTEFWEDLLKGNSQQEAISDDVRSELELTVELGRLLGTDPALIRRVLELRNEGRWKALTDLADFDFDDWCELIESLETPETQRLALEATPLAEDDPQWVEESAEIEAHIDALDSELEDEYRERGSAEELDLEETTYSIDAADEWDRLFDSLGILDLEEDAYEIAEAAYEDIAEFEGDEFIEEQSDGELDDDELTEEELQEDEYDELGDLETLSEDAPSEIEEGDPEDEEDEPSWAEIRAEAILDTLEEAFPSAFIRRELIHAEELGEGARRLLERAPSHDFLTESIRERVSQEPELFDGLESNEAQAALEEIEAVERVSRVTPYAEEVALLVGNGFHSANEIAAYPQRHFGYIFGEALGGRAQAARVHAQAQQTAAASTQAMVRLLQALQQTPLALGGSVALAQATRDRALKDIPDAHTLFGNIGLCGCEHCGSVYSPAAYLVDLLRYLDIRDPGRLKQVQEKLRERRYPVSAIRRLSRYRPLDVLLARRPDLADIPLTCENTLTPLPYIDLVNELLEARITARSAAHDTGSTPADVLKAVPQFIDRDAYERTREAVYPTMLPFHEPLAVARAYLGHLGVQRRDLLKAFARGEGAGDALLAEALETSPEEFAIVARPPSELWRHFGFDSEQVGGAPYTQALAQAPSFLSATGITFKELIELVSTRFINSRDGIKLESPSPDCDPEKVTITGLDESHLSKMVRMLRLRKRLDWSLTDLDRALFALGAQELDPPLLRKLIEARDLSKQLDKPIAELLGLWASLDTFGKDNQFDRLLRTRAIAWRTKDADTFKLQENRLELAHTTDSLDPVAPALLAAFRITSEELSLIRAIHARLTGKAPRQDLAGLSAVYRIAFLARALKLRIDQLDGLLRLAPVDANPFRAADPAATRRFVEIANQVQASAFSPEKLIYLYHPMELHRRDPGPTESQVQSMLGSIRRGLIDAFNETARPKELTGDFLRQKLGMWLDAALVDPAMDVLDPRTKLTAEKRRQFFDRHLARIFSDAGAAAQSLFAAPPASPATTARELFAEAESGTSAPPAPTSAAALAQDSGGEQRWRANIELVVHHLLPLLRARRMRGAVVQGLSDALGTSSVSTGRLLDSLMRSRRSAGGPLIDDFFALLGTGLTGRYYSNSGLQGEPAATRTDAKLEFSWAGASPAPGVAATGFSIRWSGRLLPSAKKPHTFFVSTDGGVRLSIKIDGTDRVLLDEPGGSGGVSEYVSKSIPLDPAKLYEIKVDYRNKGAAAGFSIQYGTSPDSKQAIPTPNLFPENGLAAFEPVALSYRRLHKAAMLLTGFEITDSHLEWLTGEPRYIDLDKLPMEPATNEEAIALFQRWRQLAELHALRKKLPTSDTDLFATFKAGSLAETITTLVKATGWDKTMVEAFVGDKGFAVDRAGLALPADPSQEPFLLRLAKAVAIQHRSGVSPDTLFAWAGSAPDADTAASIVQAVKARYDEKRWLEVAEDLNEKLRLARREALVAYLLPRLREQGVKTRNQLFEYFLIDVDMNPCMLTSRIKQAISAVQTFFQRSLMNLEPQVPPRLIDQKDWKWLKNYRVWEANRKIFLYPENWIEPELRDDKSPQFKTLERTILQQEIKKENVESAFIDYLQSLDEVSRLDVRAVWFEPREKRRLARGAGATAAGSVPKPAELEKWEQGTYHIFARTYNAPHAWYYRQLERGRIWRPWEKLDIDIDGDHLVPVMFQNRLHLFWAEFREKSKKAKLKKDAAPFTLGKDWEINLAYSVYDRGRWTRKQLSSHAVVDRIQLFFLAEFLKKKEKGKMPRVEGSAWLSTSAYTLWIDIKREKFGERNKNGEQEEKDTTLTIYLYRRAVDRLQAARGTPPSGEDLLSRTDVELIARFELEGCSGELSPVKLGSTAHVTVGLSRRPRKRPKRRSLFSRLFGKRRRSRSRPQPLRLPPPSRMAPFQGRRGGRLPVPPGYRIDNTGFSPAKRASRTLRMPASPSGGMVQILGRQPGGMRGVRILPIFDTSRPPTGIFPFFFQDRMRTYFVRPVPTWVGARTIRIRKAVPLVGPGARRIVPSFGRRKKARLVRRRRGRRRESLELIQNEAALDAELGIELISVAPDLTQGSIDEAIDDWEDAEDDAWHPDDADERRRRRKRVRPKKGRRRPPARSRPRIQHVMRIQQMRQAAHWEQRLRFTPFEHPQTCRLINILKSDGIDRLLALSTTRSSHIGEDHRMVNGRWVPRRRSSFQRRYRPGRLVDRQFPRLDVDFDNDNPYALYNWELFFHAPLQVAVRLAKDGRHEEAQRWFHFIFDPTIDVSSPAPQRYWRFAPFHENTEYDGAKRLMALLSYNGKEPSLIDRQRKARDQVSAWWEKPFDPHTIARLRMAAYQKAVVMKYIDNLIEWGDKLFRRDTMESIQEATQIYILAGNILGRRPERVPPMVKTPPVTFRQVREKLDPFANWAVRFENSQVRRPFRINARPDMSGTASILGMSTQYFCIPNNPDMEKKWDTVEDRLNKIRNCMNIKGIVRQLPLFEPPIEPGMLVRAAAAGVDLGSVIASLNAPPPIHRFRFLVQRAIGLAEQLRSFGSATLKALERRDAEKLAVLRQTHETALLEAVRDVQKTRSKQVEEEVAWLALQRESVDMQLQHVVAQAQELMNPQETAKQESLTEAKVIAGVAEGVDLVAKVMYAIPEFQAGSAGGFSSPFVTAQMGGQMAGDILTAAAESAFKIMSQFQTEAEMSAAQAEYQRRQAELMHQGELLMKERERLQKQIGEIQLKLEISNAELKRHDTSVENARSVSQYLRDKFTSEELYGWMLGQVSTVYFQAYKFAFDTAKLAERALQFERGDPSASYIEFSYWDSLKKGLLSGERLLLDVRRMESAYLEADQRALEITRHVSLKEDAPTLLEELLATGRCRLDISETLLDGDFPGHYFRRVRTVGMSVVGPLPPHSNIHCTLTLLDNRIRTSSNASGSYAQAQDGDDSRFLINVVPVQAIATSRPNADSGMFQLRFDDDRNLPFEGAGAISSWRIDLHQANNAIDLSKLTDVVLSLSYTARSGGAPLEAVARANRETGLARGGLIPPPQHRVSLQHDLPAQWKRLQGATAGESVELVLPLEKARLPGRLLELDPSIERVTLYARSRNKLADDLMQLQIAPQGGGAAVPVLGWTRPWPASQTLRASADIKGAPGSWKLSVGAKGAKVPDVLDDLVLVFDIKAKKV